jgi:hypothetical protein
MTTIDIMIPGPQGSGTLVILPAITGTAGMEFLKTQTGPFIGQRNKRSIVLGRATLGVQEVTFLRQISGNNHFTDCDTTVVAPFNANLDVFRVFTIIRQWTETSAYAQLHEDTIAYLREKTTAQQILDGLSHRSDPLMRQSYLMGDQLMFMVLFFLKFSDLADSEDSTVHSLRGLVADFFHFRTFISLSLEDLDKVTGLIGFEVTLTSISLYIWKN